MSSETCRFNVFHTTVHVKHDFVRSNYLKSGIDISGLSDLGSIEIDNTPPTAKFSDGHTYDVSTGILSLFGIDFSTMDEDNLDWTKFSWDVDGTGENSTPSEVPLGSQSQGNQVLQ